MDFNKIIDYILKHKNVIKSRKGERCDEKF